MNTIATEGKRKIEHEGEWDKWKRKDRKRGYPERKRGDRTESE